MKYIFFFLLHFLSCAAYSQDSTATTFEIRNNVFFVIEKTYFSGGRILTEERPADADTAAAVNQIISPALKSASQYANIAATAARINIPRKLINETSNALQSLTGQNYYTITNRLLMPEILPTDSTGQYLEQVYVMRVNNTPIPVILRRNQSGQLVMKQGSTNFQVDIVSRNWLRIRRYQGTDMLAEEGTWIDVFQESSGAYISADLKYRLLK